MGKVKQCAPAFPIPNWEFLASDMQPVLSRLEGKLGDIVQKEQYDTSSCSIELTSHTRTLWQAHHTARVQDKDRPGTQNVNTSSLYRIASVTKSFTVLGLLYQQRAGRLSLDAPVATYIEELRHLQDSSICWEDITLRDLASQLSGLPKDYAQCDLLNLVKDPSSFGLPPASKAGLPECGEYQCWKPCNETHLFRQLEIKDAIFAPREQSSYSNINYDLLGIVLERVTGLSYKEYMNEHVFKTLGMAFTTLETPSDDNAVLPILPPNSFFPVDGKNSWDVDLGVENPSGGMHSSSGDLSKFLRYLLRDYNSITKGLNWTAPCSLQQGMSTYYGMPWETFRTDRYHSDHSRPTTFVMKTGGLSGYYSNISVLQEYGLGLTILVGGNVALVEEAYKSIWSELLPSMENIIWRSIDAEYSGTYTSTSNLRPGTISFLASADRGLCVTQFHCAGINVLNTSLFRPTDDPKMKWHAQLVCTQLFQNKRERQGEIWYWVLQESKPSSAAENIWDDFDVSDIDVLQYAGKPIHKIIFWREKRQVEIPAWELVLQG